MRFSVPFYDVATGAVVDTFKSLVGLKAADTAGYRFRVRSISIGGAGAAPQDIQVTARLIRSDNTGDGTSTAATPTQLDSDSLASKITAGVNYTAEPTTLEATALWECSFNARGTIIKEWSAEDAPIVSRNMTGLLQATPGTANAVTLAGTVEFEEF